MSLNKESLTKDLSDLVGTDNVIFNDAELKNYGLDRFGNKQIPLLVVKPSAPLHFKRLNFILKRYKIDSVTPRGRGLGINLGAFSEDIIIDLTLLKKKFELESQKFTFTAEAGITFEDLQKKLEIKGFRLPIEPLLDGTLGGFIASGGYGYGSYKHGNLVDFIRSITVFLLNGKVIQTGTDNAPAYSSGYNLNSLICGSEGYFGIILDSTLEVISTARYGLNILLTIKNDTKLAQTLTEFTKLSTIFNVSLYKSILNTELNSIKILIRLEGPQKAVEQEYSFIKQIQNVTVSDSEEADRLWENRLLDPSQIPAASSILETLIPIKQLPQFFSFFDRRDSPSSFGILINANTALLYTFINEQLSISQKNEILTELLQKSEEFQSQPPTIGNNFKKFVEKSYPNLQLLKRFKAIFDEFSRMKSRKLDF